MNNWGFSGHSGYTLVHFNNCFILTKFKTAIHFPTPWTRRTSFLTHFQSWNHTDSGARRDLIKWISSPTSLPNDKMLEHIDLMVNVHLEKQSVVTKKQSGRSPSSLLCSWKGRKVGNLIFWHSCSSTQSRLKLISFFSMVTKLIKQGNVAAAVWLHK